jgi:hypothetical protein
MVLDVNSWWPLAFAGVLLFAAFNVFRKAPTPRTAIVQIAVALLVGAALALLVGAATGQLPTL